MQRGVFMSCKSCHVDKEAVFDGEIALHFPGLNGLGKPIVWVFPLVRVCLECGVAEFDIPKRQMRVLSDGAVPAD